MFGKIFLIISVCGLINCSHADHWQAEKSYNEQHREHLPIVHAASTSIVTQRVDHGVIDLPGVKRVTSDEIADSTTINVATTIDVKTNSKCCNSKCCDDDRDNTFWCCC